jgi:hypothetical protein
MSRSHIRIKSLISVRMAAEEYKNTASYSEIASRENGSDGRPALVMCGCIYRQATTRGGTGSLRASETLGSL